MTTTEKTKELKQERKPRPIEIARDTLKTLSEEVKDLVDDGTFATINDAIMETLYKQGGHRIFNTFMGWKRLGKKVKKGEKAFLLWGRPKDQHGNPATDREENNQEAETAVQDPTEENYKFYPIAYLFSNRQVEDSEEVREEENHEVEQQEHKPHLEPLPYD